MKKEEYKVLGHKVNYNVTESSTEFNSLDPSRPDAANDEAVANIVYRGMNPQTRYEFLHGREEVKDGDTVKVTAAQGVEDLCNEMQVDFGSGLEVKHPNGTKVIVHDFNRFTETAKDKDGKPRIKDGAEVTKFVEAEEQYYNRALSMLVATKKFASEDAARLHFQPLIEGIALAVPFDVKATERAERGPKKLPAKYKIAAAKVLATGRVDAVNSNQLTKITKTFTATGDTTKMFTGEYPDGEGKPPVAFNVSDKDADALGWLLKEYFDWKNSQELAAV